MDGEEDEACMNERPVSSSESAQLGDEEDRIMDSTEEEVESIFGGEEDEQLTTYDDAQVSVECLG